MTAAQTRVKLRLVPALDSTAHERFNAVEALLDPWAREDPDAPALLSLDGAGEIVRLDTAMTLAWASREAARVLVDEGVKPGDRILVMLGHGREWYAALLGCIRIGAVPMPVANTLTPDVIERCLRTGEPVGAITHSAGAAQIDATAVALTVKLCVGAPLGWIDFNTALEGIGDGEVPVDVTAMDDPMIVHVTSAQPLVEHPQSYALGIECGAHGLRPGDRHWTISNTGWAKATWRALFGPLQQRACIVQVAVDEPDADTIRAIRERFAITSV